MLEVEVQFKKLPAKTKEITFTGEKRHSNFPQVNIMLKTQCQSIQHAQYQENGTPSQKKAKSTEADSKINQGLELNRQGS